MPAPSGSAIQTHTRAHPATRAALLSSGCTPPRLLETQVSGTSPPPRPPPPPAPTTESSLAVKKMYGFPEAVLGTTTLVRRSAEVTS